MIQPEIKSIKLYTTNVVKVMYLNNEMWPGTSLINKRQQGILDCPKTYAFFYRIVNENDAHFDIQIKYITTDRLALTKVLENGNKISYYWTDDYAYLVTETEGYETQIYTYAWIVEYGHVRLYLYCTNYDGIPTYNQTKDDLKEPQRYIKWCLDGELVLQQELSLEDKEIEIEYAGKTLVLSLKWEPNKLVLSMHYPGNTGITKYFWIDFIYDNDAVLVNYANSDL